MLGLPKENPVFGTGVAAAGARAPGVATVLRLRALSSWASAHEDWPDRRDLGILLEGKKRGKTQEETKYYLAC